MMRKSVIHLVRRFTPVPVKKIWHKVRDCFLKKPLREPPQMTSLRYNTLEQDAVFSAYSGAITNFCNCTTSDAGNNIPVTSMRDLLNKNGLDGFFVQKNVRVKMNSVDVKLANKTRAVIVGGGGYFSSDTNPNDDSGWQWHAPIDELQKLTVPLFLLGVGYNRFRGQKDFKPIFTKHIRVVADKAEFIGLQNYGSINALKQYLPSRLHGKLRFHPCATTVLSKIYDIPQYNSERFIAVNCAFDRPHMRYGDNYEQIMQSIARAVKALSKLYKIKYYVFHTGDAAFFPYLDSESVEYEKVYLKRSDTTANEIMSACAMPELFIGMCGQAQLIPFGCGTPTLSLISHDKLQWFLEDIKHPEWGVDVNEADLQSKIVRAAENMLKDKENIKKQICAAQDELYKILQKNIADMCGVIDKREMNTTLSGVVWLERRLRENIGARSTCKAVYAILKDNEGFNVVNTFDNSDIVNHDNRMIDEAVCHILSSDNAKIVSLRESLSQAKYLVLNGEGSMIFKHPLTPELKAYIGICVAAKILNPKIKTLYINSVCSPAQDGSVNKNGLDEACKYMPFIDKITFRDHISADFARKNLRADSIYIPEALFHFSQIYPGLALPKYSDEIQPFGSWSMDFGQYDFSNPYILVSDSSIFNWQNPDTEKVALRYAKLICELSKLMRVYVMRCSKDIGSVIIERAAALAKCVIIPSECNILQLGAVLGNARAFVSGRFHPSIIASLGGTPCVMTDANCHKSAAFLDYFKGINIPDNIYDSFLSKDEDIDGIIEDVRRVVNDEALRNEIKTRAKQLGEQAVALKSIL